MNMQRYFMSTLLHEVDIFRENREINSGIWEVAKNRYGLGKIQMFNIKK